MPRHTPIATPPHAADGRHDPREKSAGALSPEAGRSTLDPGERTDARRILVALMFPSILMPVLSTMTSVALPVIRDAFAMPADLAAWVSAVFTLPFMVLMPVFGRLSDGLDKRRLILLGIVIFFCGTVVCMFARDIPELMAGRAIQGVGLSGMIPLGMALISSIFSAKERGRSLGTWSSVGPAAGFVGPLLAGFIVAGFGWRGAFGPPLLFSAIAFAAVIIGVPREPDHRPPHFLRRFDWGGVVLLAVSLTAGVFYLTSRTVTGVPPLRDWRLLLTTVVSLTAFLAWESRRSSPFVALRIFRNRTFSRSSFCASMRMFGMGALHFLIPLYLADVHDLGSEQLGGLLMIMPGAMTLVVRFGGGIADRFGSRAPVLLGFVVQATTMIAFWSLQSGASLFLVAAVLAWYGLGVGIMLAALHRAVMRDVTEQQMGQAAGLYSMFRFLGALIGTALAGVILQANQELGLSAVSAYQGAFLGFTVFPVLGLVVALGLRERR